MDFAHSESEKEVRDLAQRIFEGQVNPDYLRTIEESGYRHDPDLWSTVAEAGLLAVTVPEEHGGMGYGFGSAALVLEQGARVLAPLPLLGTLVGGTVAITMFGNDKQQKQWLPDIATGKTIIGVALGEIGNLNLYQPATTAIKNNDGWTLNGSKGLVSFADISERIVVSAKTKDGCALIMLDPKANGVTLSRRESTAREPQFMLNMDNVSVAEDDVLCCDAAGADALRVLAQHMMAGYCAMAIGVSEEMMRLTASYVSEREQFGVKIGTFQAVQHRAADCFVDNMCLRLTTEQAISSLEHGLDAHRQVQVAKIWVGDATHRVSYASQHMHGGTGVDRDYALFRYCLWAKHIELALLNSASITAQMGAEIAAEYL